MILYLMPPIKFATKFNIFPTSHIKVAINNRKTYQLETIDLKKETIVAKYGLKNNIFLLRFHNLFHV